MPLPADESILPTANGVIETLQAVFGKHPGFRPAHAKGTVLSGTFTPTPEAAALSTAPHFNHHVPIWVRFSNSTGIPVIPDADPNASPRGVGLRFHLGDRKHTDIIAHSTPHFPVNTGEDFLKLFQAIAATKPDSAHPTPVEQFLGAHPAALRFIQAPKPTPVSYATEGYWGLNAFKLVDSAGKGTFVRWYLTPAAGFVSLPTEQVESADPDFLQKELPERLATGPIIFKLEAQVADEGDVTDDVTVEWPSERKVVVLGEVSLDAVVADNEKESKYVIFDPIPRVEGIEPSADPLLDFRAAVYLLSGRERRAA